MTPSVAASVFSHKNKHARPFKAGLLLDRDLPDLKQMLKVRGGETDRRQKRKCSTGEGAGCSRPVSGDQVLGWRFHLDK